jgi:hypothetical protein
MKARRGFYRSDDGRATFSAQKVEPEAIAVDTKGNVYIATFDGVSRSIDNGKTRAPFNDG